jgi:tripartite-type tricarboxylate transporter receptor subunit TctC
MKISRWMKAALGAAIVATSGAAFAQATEWPARPVRLLVGFPPGGPVDLTARAVADKLAESLKQPVLVEHQPGANGTIAAAALAKAAPDGYTLMMGASTMPIQATLMKLPYDLEKDIEPIALVGRAPLVLVVNPRSPANSVAELVSLAKSQPGRHSYANPSNGSANQLAAELFKSSSGTDFLNVAYKGGAPAETDLMGGHVTMMFGAAPSTLPHVRAGRMRALAVTSAERAPIAPEIPTLAESGYPGFDVTTWYGVMGPAGTPRAVVERINAEINRVLGHPDVQERLARLALSPAPGTSQGFRDFMRREQTRWAKVIKDANITADP